MTDAELEYLIKDYDLPIQRKTNFNKNTIQWLFKNIGKYNSNKPKFDIVFKNISYRLKNKIYSN